MGVSGQGTGYCSGGKELTRMGVLEPGTGQTLPGRIHCSLVGHPARRGIGEVREVHVAPVAADPIRCLPLIQRCIFRPALGYCTWHRHLG